MHRLLSVACARGTCEHGNWSGCAAARAATPGAERVALLLTGLIRTFDITHPRLRAEFVVPLERRGAVVDVFVQTSAEVICRFADVCVVRLARLPTTWSSRRESGLATG